MTSRERWLSGGRKRQVGRSPVNSAQYFMERVEKVRHTQLFQTALKEKRKEGNGTYRTFGTISPALQDDPRGCKTTRSRGDRREDSDRRKRKVKGAKLAIAICVLQDFHRRQLEAGMSQLRRNLLFKEKLSNHCADAQSTRFESQFSYHTKHESLSLASVLALTQCPNCQHVGLSLLTNSTKEQLSPKFLQKIKGMLPSASDLAQSRKDPVRLLFPADMKESATAVGSSLTKDDPTKDARSCEGESTHGIPDISEIHINPLVDSISLDSSPLDSATEQSAKPQKRPKNVSETLKNEISFDIGQSWKGESNLTDMPKADLSSSRPETVVPRLNFSELSARKGNKKFFDRRKNKKCTKELQGDKRDIGAVLCWERLREMYNARVRRGFDMILLSRAPKRPSFTFVYSSDDLLPVPTKSDQFQVQPHSSFSLHCLTEKLQALTLYPKRLSWQRLQVINP